jgi:hypothetical protein
MQILPFPLELAASKSRVVIGPRVFLLASDTVDQVLAAGATAQTSFDSTATGSNPLGGGGTDIVLAPDQALLIEEASVAIANQDGAGKIQVINAWAAVLRGGMLRAQDLPLARTDALPYTFPPILSNLRFPMLKAPTIFYASDMLVSNAGIISLMVLTNTDVGASHTYRRGMIMMYRIIGGLDPTRALVIEDSSV